MITLKTYEEQDESIIIQRTEPDYHDVLNDFSRQTIKLMLKDEIIVGWLHQQLPENSLGPRLSAWEKMIFSIYTFITSSI